ncbi:cyclic nucleotide-binding domain-containing protein [Zhenpiania hominis]|uniref:cyclic nucleotide-binding domain-containing protein n=1 Tax=Zhenpiania hominis TaxID=2763644 RepID=UPI0039F4817F
MKKFTLLDYVLFNGIPKEDMEMLLACIGAKIKFYKEKDDLTELLQNEQYCFLLLSGRIRMTMPNGNVRLLKENTFFGNVGFSEIVPEAAKSATYQAETLVTILVMDHKGIENPCWFSCFFHHRLRENAERLYWQD